MTQTLSFFVPGRPFAKKRPRFGRGRTYTDPETVAAEHAVRFYARRALPAGFVPFAGPVRVEIEFRFERAARQRGVGARTRWFAQRADLDNLVKLAVDALNPKDDEPDWPGAWTDDALICESTERKLWADAEHLEGTYVTITECA